MTVAAKCAPDEEFLVNVERAGISAVELYTNLNYLHNLSEVKKPVRNSFRYALHAPDDCFEPHLMRRIG